MSEFNVGDLVEAVKGETVIRGRIKPEPSGRYFWVGDSGRTTESFTDAHFTVSVIEKAAPSLPTEPGHYQDAQGRHWLHQIYDGAPYGAPGRNVDQWINFDGGLDDPRDSTIPGDVLPLVKLEPVPVTAKKVLDRLGELYDNELQTCHEDFAQVAKEFGVE